MERTDSEGVTDCISSAVRAVNHVSSVASHQSRWCEWLGLAVWPAVLLVCVVFLNVRLLTELSERRLEWETESIREGWSSPSADDESTDEDDEQDDAAHHGHQQHRGVCPITNNGSRDCGHREEGRWRGHVRKEFGQREQVMIDELCVVQSSLNTHTSLVYGHSRDGGVPLACESLTVSLPWTAGSIYITKQLAIVSSGGALPVCSLSVSWGFWGVNYLFSNLKVHRLLDQCNCRPSCRLVWETVATGCMTGENMCKKCQHFYYFFIYLIFFTFKSNLS